MQRPSLEEFELEDLTSEEEMSDEQLSEQALKHAEADELPEAEFSFNESSVAVSEDKPEATEDSEKGEDALTESAMTELLTRLDKLISILETDNTASVPVDQPASRQFATAVKYIKSDNNHYLGAKWFRKAAMQGHVKAQLYLGLMFLKGEGLPKSFFHAYAWLSIAACQNNAEAREALNKLEPYLTTKETKAALKHAACLMEDILA